MLHLCSGNQLENLADQLALDLSKSVNNFIESELIAVPGVGFGRWLSLRIAHQRGVCANIRWKLPADLIWFLFRTAIPNVPEANAFSSEALAWRVFDILSDNDFVKSHKPLRNYLASGDPLKSWQLSKKLGHLFEQYLIYRPDWILEWQRRTPKHWQAEVWNRLVSKGINQLIDRHILNTNGVLRFPNKEYEMVRLGIGLYGVSNDNNLQQVSTLKSVISQVRIIKKGSKVGYDASFLAKEDMRIGVVPFGYADGLNRKLSTNNGVIIVQNIACPIIGKISMDSCMIDLKGTTAKIGDEVVIFGEENTISSIANKLSTIPYEIFSSLNRRIKRIYSC